METTGIAEAGKFISLEQFFAAMDRIAAEAAEGQKEFDRRTKEAAKKWQREAAERQKEADRRQKEAAEEFKELKRLQAETAEQMKETDKKLARLSENLGGLNNSLGSIIEILIAARLWEKFSMYGLDRGFQRVPIFDENKRGVTDIDILLSDTDCAIAVEVKTNLNKKDYVDRHIERLELVRRYPPAEIAINSKRVMGAMAGWGWPVCGSNQ
jgi:DNA repair exonuclease SbcCD ATPase subunit